MVAVGGKVTMSGGIVGRYDLYDVYRYEAAGRGTLDDATRATSIQVEPCLCARPRRRVRSVVIRLRYTNRRRRDGSCRDGVL